MSKIGNYFTIEPDKWLFETHGDVIDGKRRAQAYLTKKGLMKVLSFRLKNLLDSGL